MQERRGMYRLYQRLAMLASGATLLQAGGCTIDDALLADVANLTIELVLASLSGTI